eukprot:gnl/MRDRNA2_/MRDRNA2_55878_c0_seq1.p1 gnl/MRDRNA2_/MRDRNA2_55878_c0~~gnl/MRDRNA2_/MRDRNA2_55878_c0_seq1.p1  ORF type:complete len:351 (+),score=65.55 gnl/MRDRNA2_/MRDRNA2_55878_c0_seq1:95-1147(+)
MQDADLLYDAPLLQEAVFRNSCPSGKSFAFVFVFIGSAFALILNLVAGVDSVVGKHLIPEPKVDSMATIIPRSQWVFNLQGSWKGCHWSSSHQGFTQKGWRSIFSNSIHGVQTNPRYTEEHKRDEQDDSTGSIGRQNLQRRTVLTGMAGQAMAIQTVRPVLARLDGVNRPDLLPSKIVIDEEDPRKTKRIFGDFTPIIDVAGVLGADDIRNIKNIIADLERTKKVKLRVLSQNYPLTPGEAIQDYWKMDDDTVLVVIDPEVQLPGLAFLLAKVGREDGADNALEFKTGKNIDEIVPAKFWSQLRECYGKREYWQKKGSVNFSINAVVSAINDCIQDPQEKCMAYSCHDQP